jgi:hypothetical protein
MGRCSIEDADKECELQALACGSHSLSAVASAQGGSPCSVDVVSMLAAPIT